MPTGTAPAASVRLVADGTYADHPVVLTRLDPAAGIHPDWPSYLRVEADRDLTADQARTLAALTGYAWKAEVRGEPLGWHGDARDYHRDTPRSVVLYADSTKTRSDDLGEAFGRFLNTLTDLAEHGTPVRKTDRAGAGTRGTRLIDGLDTTVTVWVDSVHVAPTR